MNDFINIKISKDILYNLFYDRVQMWRNENDLDFRLYMKYYERMIDEEIFSKMQIDVMKIVDNDIVNNLEIIEKDDADFEKLLEIYKAEGLANVSCYDFQEYKISFIEEVDDEKNPTMFLVRY